MIGTLRWLSFRRSEGATAIVTRRLFTTIAAASAVAPFAPTAAHAAGPAEAIGVTETDTDIQLDNGPVQLTISKTSVARLTGLTFDGQDMLGSGGRGNYDMDNAREGDALPLPPTANSYEIRRGDDFVDVTFRFSPTSSGPFWLERHYIVRAGEPGLHLATVFEHTPDLHGFRSDQHRYVFYLDPERFTHASVEDDPIGVAWRAGAAAMPTPAELSAGPMIMDATYDLDGLGSAYSRRYYTKYDWATYVKDHVVHGLYGNGYGIWVVQPNREAFSGAPWRQDLNLHQTTSRPVLLVEPHGTHYGSPPVRVTAGQDWAKTYGPHFVYLGKGDDPAVMRAEALRYANPAVHRDFYDRVALPGWVPAAQRSTVRGQIDSADTGAWSDGRRGEPGPLRGAVAVLSDNKLESQQTVLGYAYWADVRPDGRFELHGVRPGTYRLTVYRPGVWDDLVRDDVVVAAGTSVWLDDLPKRATAPAGRLLWQIGTPNHTSVEFRRGPEFRQWGTWRFFAGDFPDGVTYQVGSSDPADWNYLQFQRIDGVEQAPWRILFDVDRPIKAGTTATLTIALAAWGMDTARDIPPTPPNLTIHVNDTAYVWTFDPDDTRGATYRSGCGGRTFRRTFSFDAALLRPAGNEIVLHINEGGTPELGNTLAYDAIKLELSR